MRKLSILLMISSVIFVFSHGKAFSFADAKNGQDCSKCHTLTKEQARNILSDIIPDVKIISVQKSPMSGLWEIGIDAGNKKAIIYLDYAKKHVISPATGGNILHVKTKTNLTQEGFQKISRVDVSKIPLKDALVMGEKNAKHKVIVFSDTD